jgi:hypothetical protein
MADLFVTGTGQQLHTHGLSGCLGPPCPIHSPSPKAEAIGSTHWRWDRGIMERLCEHGVGHPDPDDYVVRQGDGVHGCDGCCRKETE